ncbi:hypothetical protein PHLCEN_2v9109, partial [Hermanssonia centrifuga]
MEYDEDVLSFQGKQKTALETFEKREQTLKGLEDALRQKDEELNGEKGILQQLKVELEEREAAIAVREEQLTLLSAFAQIEDANQTLKRLEDIYSCSLLADEIIQQYLNELASVPALPDEDGSTIDQNTSKGKGKGKSLPEDEVMSWREGGSARRDWLERE